MVGPILTPVADFPAAITAYAVDRVRFELSEAIQSESFDVERVSLLLDGSPVDLPEGIRVTVLDQDLYEISGLATATIASGVL